MGLRARLGYLDSMKLLVLLLALLSASCSSLRAQADFDPRTDFSRYSTFALAEPPERAPVGLAWYSRLRGEELNRRLAAALVQRGLREVPASEAELELSFQLTGEPRADLRYEGGTWVGFGPRAYWYHGPYYGPGWHGSVAFSHGWYGPTWYGPGWYARDVYELPYVVGTLVVDAHERATGQLLWHAWVSARFDGDDAQENCERMVKALMKRWPRR
jgi:hypothetical protein